MAEAIRLEGLDSVKKLIDELPAGLQRAGVRAQNSMAYWTWDLERDQLARDIDRVTPYSVSSIAYKKVGASSFTVGNLTVSTPNIPGAGVFVVDRRKQQPADERSYLGVQIFGGTSAGPKGSELALRAMGLLPSGKVWVPASNVKLDAYGNVRAKGIQAMVADLKANGRKGKEFVVVGPPGDERGIFTKIGDEWYPWLWFVTPRTYQARFGFYERAEKAVQLHFKGLLDEEINKELAKMANA